MKKLFLLSVALLAASAANAEYVDGGAAAVGDFKGNGYDLKVVWGSDVMKGDATARAGIGYDDKFYLAVNGAPGKVAVYGPKGFIKDIAVPGNVWVSATADDAGHVLIRTTEDPWPSGGAYAGAYYPDDGHRLVVLDGKTGEILGSDAYMNDGLAFRFDALGHVNGDVTAGWWEVIGAGDGQVANDFMFDGIGPDCSMGTETFAIKVNSAFANSGAGAGKTTGAAQIFGEPNEDGMYTKMAVYVNPVVNITGDKDPLKVCNGIQLYEYLENEGVFSWTATDKFFITPQHASNNGFIVFTLEGKEYIAYTSGDGGEGVIAPDAIAISEVKYADTPVMGENDTDVLVARLYASTTEAYENIYKPGSMFTCFNIERIPDESNSVYLYVFCQGAPMIKLKFTVPEGAGIDDVIVTENENAPVEYFNLQGVRVANPETGIFIKKQGSKVSKIVK